MNSRTMKRLAWGGGVLAGLLVIVAALALTLAPPKVSPEAIQTVVTRTPELLERAWALPVAASFKRELT